MFTITQIPMLQDNYSYILTDDTSDLTLVVDPAEVQPVIDHCTRAGRKLTHILNTHHHGDHTGGNRRLKQQYDCQIIGPADGEGRIPAIDQAVSDGDRLAFGQSQAQVIGVPGHTSSHIAFYFAAEKALFCGDTLFALGCGRVFEGTMPQMWHSLLQLRALPDDTLVCCAHEYTQSNARFVQSLGLQNPQFDSRLQQITALRAAGKPTVPSLLGDEKATNPFLMADDPAMARALGLAGTPAAEIFGRLRQAKDQF